MRGLAMGIQIFGRVPVFIKEEPARFLVRDMKIILDASLFSASWIDEG